MRRHQIEEAHFFFLQLINHFSPSQNLFLKNILKNTLNKSFVHCAKSILVEKQERGTYQFVLKL